MEAGQQLGKYKLVKKLAVGGMAEIWLAEQIGPAGFNKQLVIKCILPHLANDQKFVEMFLDEARLAANLEHPNIVRISDLGQEDGTYFIAMEYIDGPDVDYIIDRCHQLGVTVPLPIAARIMADALNGLEYAHTFVDRTGNAVKLVHRDISPHNVLVNRAGVAKIVDFGVAKAATSSHKTQTGAVKGKFAYMSPEQIANADLDGRSDVFAMGIVLYELTTNHRPFGDEGELLAVTAILTKPPTNPREIVHDFPPQMEEIIMRALAKDRNQRYGSAREMSQELEKFIINSGEFASTNDVGAFLQDLFSESPQILNGKAAPSAPPRYDLDSDEGGVTSPTGPTFVPDSPPKPVKPTSPPPGPTGRIAPIAPPPELDDAAGGSKVGLIVGVIAVLVILLGVGGGVAAVVFSDDDNPGGRSSEVIEGGDAGDTAGTHDTPDAEVASEDVGEPDAKEAKSEGSVVVKASQPISVFFKNKKLGVTPLTIKLPVGKQKVVLKDKEKLIKRTVTVEVRKGEIAEIDETFAEGDLLLTVEPSIDNRVWIDGEEYTKPLNQPIRLVEGDYMVKVTNGITNNTQEKHLKIKKDALTVEKYKLD